MDEQRPQGSIIARYFVVEIVLAVLALAVLAYKLVVPETQPWIDAAAIGAGILAWLVFRMRQPRPPK